MKLASTLLELAGMALVVVGLYAVAPWLGALGAGAALLIVGYALGAK